MDTRTIVSASPRAAIFHHNPTVTYGVLLNPSETKSYDNKVMSELSPEGNTE